MTLREWLQDLSIPDTPLANRLFSQLEEWAWFTDYGMLCVYEQFTFDFCFKLLLLCGLDHEDALFWMLAECEFSALVWQERIHNKAYRRLRDDEFLSSDLAVKVADYLGPRSTEMFKS